jgi:hypothetical protein
MEPLLWTKCDLNPKQATTTTTTTEKLFEREKNDQVSQQQQQQLQRRRRELQQPLHCRFQLPICRHLNPVPVIPEMVFPSKIPNHKWRWTHPSRLPLTVQTPTIRNRPIRPEKDKDLTAIQVQVVFT